MSKRPVYANTDKLSKKSKRELSKSLLRDLKEWAPVRLGQEEASECLAPASQASEPASVEASSSPDLAELHPDSEGTAAIQSSEKQDEEGESSTEEANDYLWNLSFLEGPIEFEDEGDHIESGPSDWFVSLHFDCDICFNCRCGVCDECVHLIDGKTCQHCDYCQSSVESGDEWMSDESSSDSELDNFDVDPLDEMSDTQRLNEEIKSDFVELVLGHYVPETVVNDMLALFRKYSFGDFPKSAKTLLKTPIWTKLRVVPPGLYWHRGLESDLTDFGNCTGCNNIKVSFSVDGVPVAKSTGADFYPICCSFNGSEEVFLAGVYYGVGKPESCNDFMSDFVEEINNLVEKGITCNGLHVAIEIDKCICDAVAKSWLLNVKAHSGYYSCCKCTVKGKFFGRRLAFLDLNCPPRTDESVVQQDQEKHH